MTMVHLAIGDAYGAGWEYSDKKFLSLNTAQQYIPHPTHKIVPGKYTDDTQMSIANAETLLAHAEPLRAQFSQSYFDCFKRDPRVGYAGSFYNFLMKIQSPQEFLEKIQPRSIKNGAAMRSSVFGLESNLSKLKTLCRMQSSVTHDTHIGHNSSIASALINHYFVYRLGKKSQLADFLNIHCKVIDFDWLDYKPVPVSSNGLETVRHAVYAIMISNSLSEVLINCVNLTGDVDTVACIAMGGCWSSEEISHDLNPSLIDGLEPGGLWGLDYLRELDHKLLVTYNLTHLKSFLS